MCVILQIVGECKRLRPGAVPSVFAFRRPEADSASLRQERAVRRKLRMHQHRQPATTTATVSSADDQTVCIELGAEMDIGLPVPNSTLTLPSPNCEIFEDSNDKETQCNLPQQAILTVDSFRDRPDAIRFYTGCKSYEQFELIFNVLGPCVNHLPINSHLVPKDQLFLTLIKLRLAKEDVELAILFGIGQKLVSRIFITWINFMFYQLNEIDFWPTKTVIQETMPSSFKKFFPTTRVIIDATEIPIQKPQDVAAQSSTFSTYKNTNTLKVLVGCSPRGLVSYVSDAYGGSTSDRQICERSELLKQPSLFESGDSIMADRGFNVQDLFAAKNVGVNIPSFLRGKSQLGQAEIAKDRKIASKRIHIERVIGLAKTFKILKQPILAQRVSLGNRIIRVCFFLCNFKTCIVKHTA